MGFPGIRNRLAVAVLVAFGVGQVSADELVLKDGSRLMGEVVKRDNGTLTFETTFAGTISVKWDQVSELIADEPVQVLLDDDTTFQARQIRNEEDTTVFADETGSETKTVSADEAAWFNPEAWRLGEGFKLTGGINFALESDRGNTDSDEIDADANLTWRRLYDRFKWFGELEYDRNNNDTTKNEWYTSGTYDYFLDEVFGPKWYVGATVSFEHNRNADLDMRTMFGPHLGYQWFESREMNLNTLAGPLRVMEDFEDEPDNNYWAAGWEIDFDRYFFTDLFQFYHRQVGRMSVEASNEVILDAWTGLRFPLVYGLVASTELKVEYDSEPANNAKETDTTFKLKLGYAW